MFKPGKIIKKFKSKDGKEVILRYPKWEDLDPLLEFINEVSKEDTFIIYSGEKISKDEEIKFLTETLVDMEKGNKIMLCAFTENDFVGNCRVERAIKGNRSEHVGKAGIVLRKKYRSQGIGREMFKTLIKEAKEKMKLKLLVLDVFAPNKRAIHFYEKFGFKKAGRFPEAVLYKGKYVDEIKMFLRI